MKIRPLLLLFALVILAPMIAFSVIAVVAFDRQQRAAAARGGVETARALRTAVDHELRGTITTLQGLATARSLERSDLPTFHEDARRLLASQREWITIALTSPDGQYVMDVAAPLGAPLPRVAESESFEAVMRTGQPAVGRIAVLPLVGRAAFAVRVPVTRNGTVVYVLTGVIDPRAIQELLQAQRIPGDWVGTVFDANRKVVARTRGTEQFLGGSVSEEFARVLATSQEGWTITHTLEGAPVYTAFSTSAVTGWGIGLGIPPGVIDGPLRRSLWTLAGGGIGLLGLGAALALVIGRRLARNLTAVAEAAGAIGRGEPVPVTRSGVAELDAVGRELATAAATRDRAETALRESEARRTTTLTSIGDAVIATDLDGRITFMNPVAVSMTGWPDAEAAGQPLSAVFHIVNEHTGRLAENPMRRVLSEGVVVGLANDTVLVSRDGRRVPIEDSAAPIRASDGRTTGVVLVFHDVSAKRQAQEEFRLVANAAPVLIWMSGPDARCTFFNQPWLEFTGRPLAAELGDGWTEGIHPDDLDRCVSTYRAAFDARQPFEMEYRLRRHDGDYRWILDRGVARYDWTGRFSGYVGTCIDITARRDGEAARRYLAAIVEGAHDAIVSKTLDGVITAWNPGAERIFGYTADEAVGRPITLIVPPDRVAEEQATLARLRLEERIDAFETVRMRKDGTRVDVSVALSPIHDLDGRLIGASKTARDITASKRLERERAELLAREQTARAEAEVANRAKDEFLAMLGHELRNPLGAISNAVHVLDHAGRQEVDAAFARQVITRQTQHLARLVDDLLDVGRVMTGKIILNRRPADLAEIVRRSITTLSTAGRLEQHVLELETAPVWVEADVVRIEQVIGNLLSNAARYTPSGGRIRVVVGREAREAVVTVEDTGSGISADLLPRIFDLFVQSPRVSDRELGGLGVGLTLVRRLVELHGGVVEAASEGRGRGSTFVVRLPGAIDPLADTLAAPPAAQRARSRRILIVEDNADSREVLRHLLRLEGHVVEEATDGPSAVEAILRTRPDVALIDIGLPGLDGYEVARRVRARPEGQDVLLVTLTGYGLEADRQRAREAGFDAHLVKPLDPEKLDEVLSKIPSRGVDPAV